MASRPPSAPPRVNYHAHRFARAQLSLVEAALCPLDADVSLQPGLRHQTQYFYTDGHRNRRRAAVVVGALDGLSAHDELYLWGLLALALAQPEPRPEFLATPYYCLRKLGVVRGSKRGGREFELFRAAVKRLAGLRYQNDHFYDPVRGEHRAVAFGLLAYSLPLDPSSARCWRFAWDPIFFELARATGGALSFDLALYRELDAATRRLYLFLKKVFYRHETSPALDLRHLAVDVLGFAPTLDARRLKWKLRRCLEALLARALLVLPPGTDHTGQLVRKQGKGQYVVQLVRGLRFTEPPTFAAPTPADSPLVDPLQAIGFDARAIARLLDRYPATLLEQWIDITLAARERHGETFFRVSPAAYFLDNVKVAATGRRSPPDWWRELRRQELTRDREHDRAKAEMRAGQDEEAALDAYLAGQAREAFERVMGTLVCGLTQRGQGEAEARGNATYMARVHFRNRMRQERRKAEGKDGSFSQGI